ncbi:MAG: hypothetical protein EHM91_11985 [Planctomycetota bacterium]|nr:MAG: hypothetical protein EHM91_11985 [Planctomycetota bacterium]
MNSKDSAPASLRNLGRVAAIATVLACGCGTSLSDFHPPHPEKPAHPASQVLAGTTSVLTAIQFEDTDGGEATFSAKFASRDRKPHRFQIRNARLEFEGRSTAWSSPRSFDIELGPAPVFVLLKFPQGPALDLWRGPLHEAYARLKEGKLRLILETLVDGSSDEISLMLGAEALD